MTMTKPKAATVNSLDTKSNTQSGSNTSLMRKIRDIFLFTPRDVLRRIYAGLKFDCALSKKQTTQAREMFMPRGILDLKLTLAEITLLLNSHAISDKERTDLQTYMKNTEITSESITHATIKEEETPLPKEHYFYAYQYSRRGQWFSSLLYPTAQEALKGITDTAILRKKLCCIVL